MAVSQKSLANLEGHKFKPGCSGNPRGRPRNRVKPLLRQVVAKKRLREIEGFTQSEICLIEQSLLTMTLAELQAVARADVVPAYMKALAVAIITDMKNGKTGTVDSLRTRQYGKEVTKVELTGRDGGPLDGSPWAMTQAEAAALLRQLEKDY